MCFHANQKQNKNSMTPISSELGPSVYKVPRQSGGPLVQITPSVSMKAIGPSIRFRPYPRLASILFEMRLAREAMLVNKKQVHLRVIRGQGSTAQPGQSSSHGCQLGQRVGSHQLPVHRTNLSATPPRSSRREVRIRVPTFFCSLF